MFWHPGSKNKLRRVGNLGSVGSLTFGTNVPTHASSSSTKGTATELLSAAQVSFDVYWVRILVSNVGTGGVTSETAVDLLGGSSTEEVLIANMLAGGASSGTRAPRVWDFPLYIPAGTRLAAQAASVRTGINITVGIQLYGGDGIPPWRVASKITTYGMGTVPNGTAITPGASGAEGSWTQIVASTTEDHWGFVPSFQVSADTTVNARGLSVDIGVGASSEVEIGGPYIYETDTAEIMSGPYCTLPAYQDVPGGSRLALRASNSGTNDSYNGVIHAFS